MEDLYTRRITWIYIYIYDIWCVHYKICYVVRGHVFGLIHFYLIQDGVISYIIFT